MATTTGIIRIIVEGTADAIRDMARDAERHLRGIQDETDRLDASFRRVLGTGTKLTLGLGALGNTLPILAGLAGSATTAAGALLVLPAAGLGAAAAIGTLKIATAGFGDAVSAADPAAFAEATASMAPAARDAAAATRELVQGPLAEMKREIQGKFFEGFSDDVVALGRTFIPILSDQLGGIATAYAGMRQEAVGALIAPAAVEDVNNVLGDTRGVLEDMRPALGNVLDGILAIAGQGSREFRGFGVAVTDVSERFQDWATSAAESGRITEIIREGKQELDDYAAIAGNVGDIIGTIFDGLAQGGTDFTGSLVEGTQALEDFLASAEGQEALAALGETLAVTAEVAREVFLTALREAGPVIREAAPAVQEFAQAVGGVLVAGLEAVGPLLTSFGQFLSDNSEIIQVATPILAGLVLGFSALKIITSVVGWVGDAARAIGALSFLIGPGAPLLLGLGLAVGAMALFAAENANAEQAARDNQAAIDGLKDTLNQLTGAATGATQAQIAQDLASATLADGTTLLRDALGRAGLSMRDFTEAAVGNPAAVARVEAQLASTAATLPAVRELFDQNRDSLDRLGIGYDEFAGIAAQGAEGFNEIKDRVRDAGLSFAELGGQFTLSADAFTNATGELGEVGAEFARLRGQVQEAGEQVRVAAQAGQDFSTVLDAIGVGLSSLANGAEPTRLMRDNLQALAGAALTAADASAEAALAAGGDLAGAAREAAASMKESRDAFLSAAEAAGIARPEAERLADSMGLIPAVVETQVLLNAEGVDAELITLAAQFAAVPDSKEITVNTLTQEATLQLQQLGFTVTTLPNGQITITATDDQARASLTQLVTDTGATVATFALDADPHPATGVITTTLAFADGSTGVLTIDANGDPATVKIDGVVYRIDHETGTLTVDANTDPADAKRLGQKLTIDRTTGTIQVTADTSRGDAAVSSFIARWNGRQIDIRIGGSRVTGSGGLVMSPRLGMAGGGFVIPGYAPGQDTFGPVWLSPGEAVLVPELARRIGYNRIMAANRLFSGGRPGTVVGSFGGLMAGGGVAGRGYLSDSAVPMRRDGAPMMLAAPSVANEVRVFIGDRELTDFVTQVVAGQDRATARRVRAGTGATW